VVIAGQGVYVDYTSDFWAQPRIANNNIANNFLVVVQRVPGCARPDDRERLHARCRFHRHRFSNHAQRRRTGDKFWADVGGDPHTIAPTYYMVVWQRNYAAGDTTSTRAWFRRAACRRERPNLCLEDSGGRRTSSRACPSRTALLPDSTQEWNIVWTRLDPGRLERRHLGCEIHWDGIITTPSFLITFGPVDDRNPAPSSPLDRSWAACPWMVVFERGAIGARDLMGLRVTRAGNLVTGANLSYTDVSGAGEDQTNADVDSDGSQIHGRLPRVVRAQPD
jgi:hypothetical protein